MIEPGAPCSNCGAHPAVECRHRPAIAPKPVPVGKTDGRKVDRGQGMAFHMHKRRKIA